MTCSRSLRLCRLRHPCGLRRVFLMEDPTQDENCDRHEEHGPGNPDDEPADLLIGQRRYRPETGDTERAEPTV